MYKAQAPSPKVRRSLEVRARISELLNSKHEFRWVISSTGDFKVVDTTESSAYVSQFERIAKVRRSGCAELRISCYRSLGVPAKKLGGRPRVLGSQPITQFKTP